MNFRAPFVYLVALATCLPLALGFPHGHDFLLEVPRIAEYRNALSAGQFPPFWASNLYGGFGSPIFLFYAPLFMLMSALLSIPLNSVLMGASVSLVVLTLLSAWFVMGAVRTLLEGTTAYPDMAARIAAYLYMLSPYLIGDKLLRSANAEFTALCFAPLAFWGLFLIRSVPQKGALVLALGIFLVVVSHNLTALVVLALLATTILLIYFPRKNLPGFLYSVAGVSGGMLMSAFFWVPVFAYKSEMRLGDLTSGRLDYHQLFAPLGRVFSFAGYSVGLLPLVVLILAVIVVLSRSVPRTLRTAVATILIGALVFVFLQTRASIVLWEAVPWLPLFQFPWRMMGPVSLLTAALGAMLFVYAAQRWELRRHAVVEAVVIALCVGNALPQFLRYEMVEPERAARVQPGLAPEAIRASPFTTTVLDEYLPRGASATLWRQRRPDRGPILGSDPPVQWSLRQSSDMHFEFGTHTNQPATVHFARWAFPVWELKVNGNLVTPTVSEFGTIDASVPAGPSVVTLDLVTPPVRRIANGVSLIAITAWIIGVAATFHRKRVAEK